MSGNGLSEGSSVKRQFNSDGPQQVSNPGKDSAVAEKAAPTFSKFLLFKHVSNDRDLTSNQKEATKRKITSSNAHSEAHKLGKQVRNNLRLNGFSKDEAKMIGAVVERLQLNVFSSDLAQNNQGLNNTQVPAENTQNSTDQVNDKTQSLLGKKHSKIGFAVRRFCNWIKGKKINANLANCLSSFIESILNNDQGKKELIFFCKTSGFDKHASAFTKLFKDELLKTENKDIFKNLPMEVQKAFIEQNKDDINFLSTFSNVYKEELKCDEIWDRTTNFTSELLIAFKDAILANKDKIIKDPTILASVDKASIFAVANVIENDIPLQKALIQCYTHITKEIVEEALKTNNKESELINQETTNKFAELLRGEIKQEDFGPIESVQILRDGARGFTFEFQCSSGKVTLTKEANRRIDEKGEVHFLSKQEILNIILEQSKDFTVEDKNALADFVINCAVQGLFAAQIPDAKVGLRIDGDGMPFIKATTTPEGLQVNVVTKGTCKDNLGNVIFLDGSILSLDKIEVEKNEFSLFYPASILKCKGKAEKIEVLEINQKQDLPLTQTEKSIKNALIKIKKENNINSALDSTELNDLMSNPQILQENIHFLDKNPAALRKIPKKHFNPIYKTL